jgi:hypothetical protein
MFQFLLQHQFGLAVAMYWVFSAAVSSMPDPKAGDAGGYLWLYRFAHTLAGNLTTAFGNRIPAMKVVAVVLLAPLLLTTPACALHYTVHPGALNTADSAAYDLLRIAQDVIDQARMDQLSPGGKDALGALISSYNVARESWLTYRTAVSTNAPSDQYAQQLTKNLTDLTNAIKAIRESAASASATARSLNKKEAKQ